MDARQRTGNDAVWMLLQLFRGECFRQCSSLFGMLIISLYHKSTFEWFVRDLVYATGVGWFV